MTQFYSSVSLFSSYSSSFLSLVFSFPSSATSTTTTASIVVASTASSTTTPHVQQLPCEPLLHIRHLLRDLFYFSTIFTKTFWNESYHFLHGVQRMCIPFAQSLKTFKQNLSITLMLKLPSLQLIWVFPKLQSLTSTSSSWQLPSFIVLYLCIVIHLLLFQ